LTTAAALLVVVLSAGAWVGFLQMTGNFHVIAPGMAYRSNTLSVSQLSDVIADNGIKTIVNLRGGSMKDEWYRNERALADRAGVVMVDIPMSAYRQPSEATMSSLLTELHSAPRPLLIHCRSGSDRTGLASALFSYVELKQPASEAVGQLAFWYGHFPWLGSATVAMDDAFWRYADGIQSQ